MAKLLRKRKLNPTRKLSAKQIKFFGTKAQKAALKRKRSNPVRKRFVATVKRRKARKRNATIVKIMPNPSGILSLMNPRGKSMYKRRRKASTTAKRRTVRRRRRRNPVSMTKAGSSAMRSATKRTTHRKKLHYAGRSKKGAYKYVLNPRRRRTRRNPNFGGLLSGTPGTIAGMLAGGAATHFINGFVPVQFRQGIPGVIATFLVASLQAKFIGKFANNILPNASKNMLMGGMFYAGLKALQAFAPDLAARVGLNGLGIVGQSSFYVPSMPLPNSMNTFYTPSNVLNAIPMLPPASNGMGNLMNARRF